MSRGFIKNCRKCQSERSRMTNFRQFEDFDRVHPELAEGLNLTQVAFSALNLDLLHTPQIIRNIGCNLIIKLWKSILSFARKKQEESFWKHPDSYLAAIILNDEREQVYGRVKNDLARLERIPKPETGFFYKDVVKIKGPIGTQLFRDDEINEYQTIELYKASNIQTFTFKAVIPDSTDYFNFLDCFKKYEQEVEFPWSPRNNNKEWRKGRCTSENLEQARKILNSFIDKKEGRLVKHIHHWDYYLKMKK